MPTHMSKSLADEIARRTLAVTNPANRRLRLGELLKTHGFVGGELPDVGIVDDAGRLKAWLIERYPAAG
jgi:hypothetical protein